LLAAGLLTAGAGCPRPEPAHPATPLQDTPRVLLALFLKTAIRFVVVHPLVLLATVDAFSLVSVTLFAMLVSSLRYRRTRLQMTNMAPNLLSP